MTATLALLCFAVIGLTAFSVSAMSGLAIVLLRKRLELLAPRAQARLYLLASLLPGFFSLLVLIAALAPSFGWIADHCGNLGMATDPHSHHPHVCATHHAEGWPAASVIVLAGFVVARLATFCSLRAYALVCGHLVKRSLVKSCLWDPALEIWVLPVSHESQAFVLGLYQPILFATEGLASGRDRHHFAAAIAHEKAHIRRNDPLRRFVAGISMALHLPLIARHLDRLLVQAHEMAADREAAESVGRSNVARALVALTRAKSCEPKHALAFTGSSIEARVHSLMDERVQPDWPTAAVLGVSIALTAAVAAAGASGIHHGVEMLLGLVGG